MNASRVILAGMTAYTGKFSKKYPMPTVVMHVDDDSIGSYHPDSIVSIVRDASADGCSFFFSIYPGGGIGTMVSFSTWIPHQIASRHAFPSFIKGGEVDSLTMKAILIETKIVV